MSIQTRRQSSTTAGEPYNKLELIVDRYKDQDLLDDRREYDPEDLQRSEQISEEESVTLFRMIQREFKPNDALWDDREMLLRAEEVIDFINEGFHGSFDGWSEQEKAIIIDFLDDLALGVRLSAKRGALV